MELADNDVIVILWLAFVALAPYIQPLIAGIIYLLYAEPPMPLLLSLPVMYIFGAILPILPILSAGSMLFVALRKSYTTGSAIATEWRNSVTDQKGIRYSSLLLRWIITIFLDWKVYIWYNYMSDRKDFEFLIAKMSLELINSILKDSFERAVQFVQFLALYIVLLPLLLWAVVNTAARLAALRRFLPRTIARF